VFVVVCQYVCVGSGIWGREGSVGGRLRCGVCGGVGGLVGWLVDVWVGGGWMGF
jgi:hypothetical protein